MVAENARQLIFRLAGISFAVRMTAVVEVLEPLGGSLHAEHGDDSLCVLGSLVFRHTHIPVIDPLPLLKLESLHPLAAKVPIVLYGADGNWAILADGIEGLVDSHFLQSCDIPRLLLRGTRHVYTQISIRGGEPVVVFEPDLFNPMGLRS